VYLDELAHSDIYLGIFGFDYGSEDQDGVSPTERGYDHATKHHKPRFVYVWGTDDSKRAPKMQRLVREASGELIRRRIQDGSALTAEVYSSLVDHLDRTGALRTPPFDTAGCDRATLTDISRKRVVWFLETARRGEVFGDNAVALIIYRKTGGLQSRTVASECDYILWFAKDHSSSSVKSRRLYTDKSTGPEARLYSWLLFQDGTHRGMSREEREGPSPVPPGAEIYKPDNPTSQGNPKQEFVYQEQRYVGGWKTTAEGMRRLGRACRVHVAKNSIMYVRKLSDFDAVPVTHLWTDTSTATGSFKEDKIYVVQTSSRAIERCILMTTDPGDLVVDPTCGSGTTAYVAEQWGRQWITIDTSRVALALARARVMGARYPCYLLADSRDGQMKEAEITRTAPSSQPTHGSIRQGFVYERVPHITPKSIAIDLLLKNAMVDCQMRVHYAIEGLC